VIGEVYRALVNRRSN